VFCFCRLLGQIGAGTQRVIPAVQLMKAPCSDHCVVWISRACCGLLLHILFSRGQAKVSSRSAWVRAPGTGDGLFPCFSALKRPAVGNCRCVLLSRNSRKGLSLLASSLVPAEKCHAMGLVELPPELRSWGRMRRGGRPGLIWVVQRAMGGINNG